MPIFVYIETLLSPWTLILITPILAQALPSSFAIVNIPFPPPHGPDY